PTETSTARVQSTCVSCEYVAIRIGCLPFVARLIRNQDGANHYEEGFHRRARKNQRWKRWSQRNFSSGAVFPVPRIRQFVARSWMWADRALDEGQGGISVVTRHFAGG
ncbi:unnamed protein product, partial [Ectocarpus sp. 4 AP-2014]